MTPQDALSLLTDHTARTVTLGAGTIGLTAGALGAFAYLRRQSLTADVIAHSALPGAMAAFLLLAGPLGQDGRSSLALVVGAVLTGTAAVACAQALARRTPIGIGAAMAAMLALFFGAGMILLRVITDGPYPGKGGVHTYLFGSAAALTRADLLCTGAIAVVCLLGLRMAWNGLVLHTLDAPFAASLGFAPRTADLVLLGLLSAATVIGMKAVGLVLMVACVISPAAAARQWTRRIGSMCALAAAIGAVTAATGALASVALELPTGPVIVLVQFACVLVSVLVGPHGGLLARARREGGARPELETVS